MRQVVGAQGEVTIIKIDEIPVGIETSPAQRIAKGWIVSHSESGHHHICTGGEVLERRSSPAGMKVLYAILKEPAQFIQDAAVPHQAHDLPAGIYEFRLAREFDPFAEQVRQVQD